MSRNTLEFKQESDKKTQWLFGFSLKIYSEIDTEEQISWQKLFSRNRNLHIVWRSVFLEFVICINVRFFFCVQLDPLPTSTWLCNSAVTSGWFCGYSLIHHKPFWNILLESDTARSDHNTGNSMPYSFRTVRGLFYVPLNCEQPGFEPTTSRTVIQYRTNRANRSAVNICSVQQESDCVPGHNEALWIHLWIFWASEIWSQIMLLSGRELTKRTHPFEAESIKAINCSKMRGFPDRWSAEWPADPFQI